MLVPDTQILATAVMFLTGAAVGLFHDLCAVTAGRAGRPSCPVSGGKRRRSPVGPVVRLWDLFYCLLVTPAVFAAVLISNRGELRFYVFVGLGLGTAAYYALAAPVVVRVAGTCRAFVIRRAAAGVTWAARPVRAGVSLAGRACRQGMGSAKGLVGGARGRARALRGAGRSMARRLGRWAGHIVAGITRHPTE